jgi:uncharacterized protein
VRFVDANVFVRAITGDDATKAVAAGALFRRVEQGQEILTTCEAVIAEVVYVLSSRGTYGHSNGEVRARFGPFLRLRGLRIPGRERYLRALDLYASTPALDFEDALVVAHMEEADNDDLLSYDRDFDRVAGVRRSEPEP